MSSLIVKSAVDVNAKIDGIRTDDEKAVIESYGDGERERWARVEAGTEPRTKLERKQKASKDEEFSCKNENGLWALMRR